MRWALGVRLSPAVFPHVAIERAKNLSFLAGGFIAPKGRNGGPGDQCHMGGGFRGEMDMFLMCPGSHFPSQNPWFMDRMTTMGSHPSDNFKDTVGASLFVCWLVPLHPIR